ncbi:hypothetical protein Anapl_15888 [Anas platyrhynchos]|uniref:Uncharacterized protein n=1 Tax=Anas platyrhynchos TaxID=8839 RepID=R0LDZ1_ANAPL|nr:hypothetical protein Anapl_15888 [Anas platyrhynchos]
MAIASEPAHPGWLLCTLPDAGIQAGSFAPRLVTHPSDSPAVSSGGVGGEKGVDAAFRKENVSNRRKPLSERWSLPETLVKNPGAQLHARFTSGRLIFARVPWAYWVKRLFVSVGKAVGVCGTRGGAERLCLLLGGVAGTGEATQEQFQTPASGPTSPAERVPGSCSCRPACWLLGCASTRVLAGVPAKVTGDRFGQGEPFSCFKGSAQRGCSALLLLQALSPSASTPPEPLSGCQEPLVLSHYSQSPVVAAQPLSGLRAGDLELSQHGKRLLHAQAGSINKQLAGCMRCAASIPPGIAQTASEQEEWKRTPKAWLASQFPFLSLKTRAVPSDAEVQTPDGNECVTVAPRLRKRCFVAGYSHCCQILATQLCQRKLRSKPSTKPSRGCIARAGSVLALLPVMLRSAGCFGQAKIP